VQQPCLESPQSTSSVGNGFSKSGSSPGTARTTTPPSLPPESASKSVPNPKYKSWLEESFVWSLKNGWFDGTGHKHISKRHRALNAVYLKTSRLDPNPLQDFPLVAFFAPNFGVYGSACNRVLENRALVYLAPTLEFETQASVNHTVAHEMAHVLLGHTKTGNGYIENVDYEKQPIEIAANKLAAEWGFPRRQCGKSALTKLVESFHRDRQARAEKRVRNEYLYRCSNPKCNWEEAFAGKAKKFGGRYPCPCCDFGPSFGGRPSPRHFMDFVKAQVAS
jgi:hypothetical protein